MTWSGPETLHRVAPDAELAPIIDAARRGGRRFLPISTRRFHVQYMDTPDLRLLRWGAMLSHVDGDGWRVLAPGGVVLTRADSSRAVPAEAAELVTAYRRGAALALRARVRVVRRGGDVVAEDGEPLAAVRLDEMIVMGDRGSPPPYGVLRVSVAEGAPRRLLRDLQTGADGMGDEVDATWPLRAALGPIGEAAGAEVVAPVVGPGACAGDLVRRSVAASVVRLFRADPIARVGTDPEGVHQMRVASRRLRSDLRTFSRYVDPGWADPLRDEVRWLGASLGGVRDADVMADRLGTRVGGLDEEDRDAGERLLARLAAQRAEARAHLLETLGSGRYLALADRLVAAAQDPPLTGKADEAAAGAARKVVPYAGLRRAVGALGPYADFAALHRVRIRAKRCRYAAEAVAPAAGKPARRFAREAARLQDVLGGYCDAVVMGRWLRATAERAGRQEAFTAGVVAGEERAAAEVHLAEVADVWRTLSRRARRLGL